MSQSLTIYAGLDRVWKRRNAALKRESKRRGISVSDIVWDALKKSGSAELQEDLKAAERECA